MLVVDEGGMHARARLVVDAKVVQLGVAAEQIAALFVDHQFLNQLVVLHHVQVKSCGRLTSPAEETWIKSVVRWISPKLTSWGFRSWWTWLRP